MEIKKSQKKVKKLVEEAHKTDYYKKKMVEKKDSHLVRDDLNSY